ncbi:SPOR domain-containing protein [Sphingomonas sp. CJ99]
MNGRSMLGAIMLATLAAAPAQADVKAGLEAWARGDYAAAVGQWRADAERGDPDAQFNLAQAYRLGRGVPQDLAQAEQWYRRAAQQNHRQASDFYGLALFQNGNKQAAVPWLEASARRGEPRAQYVLGTMYFNGDVVARDHARAFALLSRASAQGITQATQTLAQIDRYIAMPDRQRGAQLAAAYERDAAAAQVEPAMPIRTAPRPATPIQVAELPPSTVATSADPVSAGTDDAAMPPPPQPVRQAIPAVSERSAAVAQRPAAPPARPVRPAVVDGGWRVQLGAFGDPGNARRLWTQVAGRFPGRQPSYPRSGRLTRLLVGPFASQSEARSACGRVSPCVPVRD